MSISELWSGKCRPGGGTQLSLDEAIVREAGVPFPPQFLALRFQRARSIDLAGPAMQRLKRGVQARHIDGICQVRAGLRIPRENLTEQLLINFDGFPGVSIAGFVVGERAQRDVRLRTRLDLVSRISVDLAQSLQSAIQTLLGFLRSLEAPQWIR